MHPFNRKYSRREVEARVGRMEQIAGVRRLAYVEGPEAGVEQIEVRTGAGLTYWVAPQRGLDIGRVEFLGAPLSWQSACGDVHPAHYDARGAEWLRTAAGGMLMTCGLRNVGVPCAEDGEEMGLHGRAHHLPASEVAAAAQWQGDEYAMAVSGTVRETRIFREKLVLRRTIASRLGENAIRIHDRITNEAFEPSPAMILYHFNFGFPLLTEKSTIRFPSRKVVPREKTTPLEGYDRWDPPTPGYFERVYFHSEIETRPDAETGRPMAEATVHQPEFPAGPGAARPVTVRLRWTADTLPHLVQWKMPGAGEHVLGIEPTNCGVLGRVADRAAGRVVVLEPGEAVDFCLELALEAGES